ncbi:hypothetical protein [Chryseobacterium sp. RU37D]|uniref:hypothetical protein n=1 Tax=Chryseobacterium sp. RU37D TaxID=1907397 RepID=UPI0015C4075D|nr:hypothetical protein [Chryseobacterium sp. RU37D]
MYTIEPAFPQNLNRFRRLKRSMILLDKNEGIPSFLLGGTQDGEFETSTTFVFDIFY